jgi:hypothetical protein
MTTSSRLETFFKTLRKCAGVYPSAAAFTTDWTAFKATQLSGLTSLDAAINTATTTFDATEERAKISFTKAADIRYVAEFEDCLLWHRREDLLNFVGMNQTDVTAMEKLLQCSMAIQLRAINEKYDKLKNDFPEFNISADKPDDLLTKLNLDEQRRLRKVWENIRKLSTSTNIRGYLSQLDASKEWTNANEEAVLTAIFNGVRTTLGVFYLNDTARFKVENLSCNLPSGPTVPFSNESFTVGTVKNTIRWSPYQLVKYAEINATLKTDIEANTTIVFTGTDYTDVLNQPGNNAQLQAYAVQRTKTVADIPADLCPAFSTTVPTHLMYEAVAPIISPTETLLATARDVNIVPVAYRNDNASLLYFLADMSVALNTDLFKNVNTESDSKWMTTWIIVIVVVLLLLLIGITWWLWGTNKPRMYM